MNKRKMKSARLKINKILSEFIEKFQQFEDRRIAAAKRAAELADLEAKAKVRDSFDLTTREH